MTNIKYICKNYFIYYMINRIYVCTFGKITVITKSEEQIYRFVNSFNELVLNSTFVST